MVRFILIISLIIYTNSIFCQNTDIYGWSLEGLKTELYNTGTDSSIFTEGKRAAFISSTKANNKTYSMLTQQFQAYHFHGKRIRFSAFLKTKEVKDWAGLWMRIDDHSGNVIRPSFDNMRNRPIKGNRSWKEFEIVLDVPIYAYSISFGALLSGKGKVWIDDILIEIVDKTVPVTSEFAVPDTPTNLNFEEIIINY